MVALYSFLYQGTFLLIYPPALLFWILFSFLLASMHRAAHSRIIKSYFSEWFLVQIWVQPLLFMAALLGGILSVFGLAEYIGEADCFRSIMQLPMDLFTNFLYILLLMVFSSGTYLFVEAVCCFVPVLQARHLGRRSKIVSRLTLVGFTFLAALGIWFVLFQRTTHVDYLGGIVMEGLDRPREALLHFQKVRDNPPRLFQSARFRMARIELLRLRDYRQALKHFSEVVLLLDSPLREEALLQSMYCIYAMEGTADLMRPYHDELKRVHSHLFDEAAFLVAQKLVREQRVQEAMAILQELTNLSPIQFTVQSWLNSEYRSFEVTRIRARRELENLMALSR